MSVGQRFAWVTFLLVKRQVLVLALATATAFAAGLTIGRHSFPQVAPGGDSVVPGESLGEGPAGLHFTASTQASPGEPGSAQTDSRPASIETIIAALRNAMGDPSGEPS